MNAKPFLDTNLLLYLLSGDVTKANRVEALVAQGGTISVQVLNEAVTVMTTKLKMGLDEVYDVLAWGGWLETAAAKWKGSRWKPAPSGTIVPRE
ncbi:hypothetical protein JKG68_20040 [Microvirga aerilata]|uniref:PIN domain-containing protein n=1 Tax=Microvirga aerilata TaxID=670292 RepID=A0A936ZKD9_9HYPH|nr:hypothetical protein [Microvirga aerilata]MBL0406254.1 hypothetical protein [Microvirga aerilata]